MFIRKQASLGLITIGALVLLTVLRLNWNPFFKNVGINISSGKTETWAEQTYNDKKYGDGFFQTRTLYTIDPNPTNTSRVNENRKLLVEVENKTKETQKASYTVTERVGFTLGSDLASKASHLTKALGVKIVPERTNSYSAEVTVAAKKYVAVYSADVRVRSNYTCYTKQRQTAINVWASAWKNSGDPIRWKGYVKEYSGVKLLFEYTK